MPLAQIRQNDAIMMIDALLRFAKEKNTIDVWIETDIWLIKGYTTKLNFERKGTVAKKGTCNLGKNVKKKKPRITKMHMVNIG